MDVQDYIHTLRLRSEQLRTLCLQLEAIMSQVEQPATRSAQLAQALTDEGRLMEPETAALLEGIAEVSTNISMTADLLQKRMIAFIEKTK